MPNRIFILSKCLGVNKVMTDSEKAHNMKSTVFYLLLVVAMTGCADTSSDDSRYNQAALQEEGSMATPEPSCPIMPSEDWRATLVRLAANNGQYQLNVSATVTLPTPGYALSWSQGITDRMHPPGLRLTLSATAPKGMVIQVLTPTLVKHTIDTPIKAYRFVAIYCGAKLLGKIDNVHLAEF